MNKTKMRVKSNENIGVSNYDVDFLETLLYEWVRRSINLRNFRLTNTLLKTTAHRFKSILNLKSFVATKEWLQKFRIIYLKDVDTEKLADISYNCRKSTLPVDIFNELLPKWESLDPKSVNGETATMVSGPNKDKEIIDIEDEDPEVEIIDFNHENIKEFSPRKDETRTNYKTTSTNEINLNIKDTSSTCTEFFDIEDELPVCTIFGRKTVQNVANIISSNKKSNDDKFQPMIVCTDPKNPNLNSKDKSTKEHTFCSSTNKPEVEKIKDLINGKLIDTDSNTSSQNEYIDQYLKEIVRVPDHDKISYSVSSKKSSLKPTSETEECETLIFKPISMEKLRVRQIKPKPQQKLKQPSEAIDTESLDSKKQLLTKPNLKRKIKHNVSESPKNKNLETIAVDQTPTIKPLTLDSTPLPAESLKSLQAEDLNQQEAFPQNITTSNFLGETIPDTQSPLVSPGRIMYTFQMAAPNQNQVTMPYISPMATNFQTTQFGQPMVLHFHSPMTLQTTEMLPGSEIMSSAVMNLPQTPSISQTSFIPSIDLTQQTTSPHFAKFFQNQFIPSTTAYVQQSLSTAQTPTIVTTPTVSTTLMQQTPILELIPSNSTQTTTPTALVPNLIPTKTIPTRVPVSKKSRTITSTITSLTSNSALSTVTACLPNFASTKIIPTTTTLIQTTASTQTQTITSSTLNSSPKTSISCLQNFVPTKIIPTTTATIQPLVSTKTATITSTPLMSNSVQKMPISITNSTPNTKGTTSMQVTITKKSRLTTDPSLKKGTRFAQRAPLKTHEEVVKCIKLMEDFAMMNEDFRLIGFLERLEQEVYIKKTK